MTSLKRSTRQRKSTHIYDSSVLLSYANQDQCDINGSLKHNSKNNHKNSCLQLKDYASLLAKMLNQANKNHCQYQELKSRENQPLRSGLRERKSKAITSDLYARKTSDQLKQIEEGKSQHFENQKSVHISKKKVNQKSSSTNLQRMKKVIEQFDAIQQKEEIPKQILKDILQKRDKKSEERQKRLQLKQSISNFQKTINQKQFMKAIASSKDSFNNSREKLFKRNAYHVAIAYHIHIRKITEKANSNENQLDPTWNAKQLINSKTATNA